MTGPALFDEQLRPAFDLRDRGLVLVDRAADDDHRARVDDVIAYLAGTGQEFSANDIRPLVEGVPAKLIAPRLEAARKAGLIVKTGGYVPSTLKSTHGHRLALWIGAGA